jgi:hypothetical protein
MITIPDGMKRPAESRRDELERENAELKKLVEQMSEALEKCACHLHWLSQEHGDNLADKLLFDEVLPLIEAVKGGK